MTKIKLNILLLLVCLVLSSEVNAEKMISLPLQKALLELSADLSENNPAIHNQVEAFIETPPNTIEEIGYYGFETMSDSEKVVRAMLTLLVNMELEGEQSQVNHLWRFSDKYSHEMIEAFMEEGILPESHNKETLQQLSVQALDEMRETYNDGDTYSQSKKDNAHAMVHDVFQDYTQQAEEILSEQGLELLSFQIPSGDSFLVIPATKVFANKWRNTLVLNVENEGRFAITSIQWDAYWRDFAYALQIDTDDYPSPISEFDLALTPIEDLFSQ